MRDIISSNESRSAVGIYHISPQKKRKTCSTIDWDTYVQIGEVSSQYVKRYFQQLGRYPQNNLTMRELFQPDPEDPHISRDF